MSVDGLPLEQREAVSRAAERFLVGDSAGGRGILAPMLLGGGGQKAICWAVARALDGAGRPELAIGFVNAACTFDSRDPILWRYLAKVASAARDRGLASEATRRAKVAEKLRPILERLRDREEASDDAGALRAANQGIALDRADAALLGSAGRALLRMDRYDEAIARFEAIRRIAPDRPEAIDAIAEIARAHYGAGRLDASIATYHAYDAARVARYGPRTSHLASHELTEHRVISLETACARRGARFLRIAAPEPFDVVSPRYHPPFARDGMIRETSPELAVGEIERAEVLSDAACVVKDGELILPCPGLDPALRQANVPIYTGFHRDGSTLLRVPQTITATVDRAVLVAGRASSNYFHFVLELLPRIFFADTLTGDDSLPLLVNRGMPKQHYEALDLVAPGRPRILLDGESRVRVGSLVLPTLGGFIPDDTRIPLSRMMIAPLSVRALRTALLRERRRPSRRIAIARKSQRRRCVNESIVMEALERRGFAIIDPESMTLAEQIEAFADASVVVMTCGAAQTNAVWMSPGARLVVLWGESVRPSYFSELGRAAGVETVFVRGRPIPGSHVEPTHRDFEVTVEHVVDAVEADPIRMSA
ncbi:MAG: glycosyltransferase 61 family protein [Sandaracinaceae bacterium]